MPYADRKKYLEYQRAYYQRDRKAVYWNKLQNRFGLSKDDFFLLLEAQNYCCALCDKKLRTEGNGLHVDHDHATGKLRGLLCMPCNVALGMLGDDEEGLLRALAYVRKDNE